MSSRTTSLSIAGAAGLLLAVAAPLSASAHVTVSPSAAAAGGYSIITVNVPNESATATTTTVELTLPSDTPFSSVSYIPVAGWTTQLVETTLPSPVTVGENEITEAVTSVIWTADAGQEIADGQLRQFLLSVGPVPDVGSLVLPATQTYSDGEVVEWAGTGDDAEEPAPVLYVNDSPPAGEHGGDDHGDETATASAADAASAPAQPTDDVLARVLGIAGLVAGAIAIVLAVSRRRSADR